MKKLVLSVAMLLSSALFAHPHVFIDATSKITKVSSTTLEVRNEWLFDGMTSESLLMEFDANVNGKIDKKEQKIAVNNFKNNISQLDYMTEVYVAGSKKKSKFEVVDQAFSTRSIKFEGKKFNGLVYSYTVKLKIKDPGKKLKFKLSFYDPTSYSEILVAKKIEKSKEVKVISSKLDKMTSSHEVTLEL